MKCLILQLVFKKYIYYKRKMRRIIIAVFITLVAVGVLSSCNKSKTYAQHLNEERKAIERFIDENDIKVLSEYPKDSVFKEKEFYFDTQNGIYYHVVDSGNGRRIMQGEELYIRFKGLSYIASKDTATYSNINSPMPEILVYGNTSTYSSPGWVAPLKNVGDRAKVKLIVPFNMGLPSDQIKLGSSSSQEAYKTAYYEELNYRFEQ